MIERRWRAAAVACAVVAGLNALAWALITPPFHVPDEPQHVAYVQYLAETGKVPRHVPGNAFSDEEARASDLLRFNLVAGNREGRPPWTAAEDAEIQRQLDLPLSRRSDGAFTNVTNNPPLYYALEVAPYAAGGGATLIERLYLMRLVSVLLAAVTVLFVFLFLRELVPGAPWAWPVGALAAAFQPLFGFVSGGVNNDALLFATSAAAFYLLARAFRRGLSPRVGLALGAAVGLGLVAKANTIGLVPGIALGLAALVWRAGGRRPAALRGALLAAGAAAAPAVLYVVLNATVWDRPLWGAGAGDGGGGLEAATPNQYPLRHFASYLWQFYLPPLPFMQDEFPYLPLWETWFKGFVARFGWLDYGFGLWGYRVALAAFTAVGALALAALLRMRGALAQRWRELLAYATMAAGLLLLIAYAGFHGKVDTNYRFEQARYLLPLLPLYAAGVALAARGAGARWGPPVGAALVVAAIGHDVFAQLVTIARYYG
jgi:4-amino-4-deoxy-L-arabinose transferase-like glycosyltransferase